MVLLFIVCLGCLLLSTACAEKVFYVKPTVPTTECPSGDSPCHSLQYYANHSSFTNNSRFLFLEGEHHLDSVVTISNVANLSLVGAGSGVEILCMSLPSGFHIKEFIGVKIESVSSNCTVDLKNGSGVSINSSNLRQQLIADDVLGCFNISSSHTDIFSVNYSLCGVPAMLTMMNHDGCLAYLELGCSNLQIAITDTVMASSYKCGLKITFAISTSNNSVGMRNFSGPLFLTTYEKSLQFGNTCADAEDPALCFDQKGDGNTVLIENTAFVNNLIIVKNPNTKCNSGVKSIFMTLRNVTVTNAFIVGPALYLQGVTAKFVDCTFKRNFPAAIHGNKSNLIFEGINIFKNNSGYQGAGMILDESYMYLMPYTHIQFQNNHVSYTGGAIHSLNDRCFFHVVSPKQRETINVDFTNNTAGAAGTSLYGGIDNCDEVDFYNIFHINNTESDPSAIASGPGGVCICKDKQPNCFMSDTAFSIHLYPGEEFPVRLAVISTPFFGAVSGVIGASTTPPNAILESQKSQASRTPSCNVFNYSVSSNLKNVGLQITAESFLDESPWKVSVNVHLMECPLGFPLSPTLGKCQCDFAANQYDVECNIKNHSYWRSANSRTWVGFVDESSNASSVLGVIYHPNCPIGYCSRHDVSFTSNTSDDQCEPHRTGLLCGECEEGYSLTLGNGKCAKCSNTYLLLLLPFAVAGLLLVVVLFALNLTVTEGTINGLIFYANVLSMGNAVQFTEGGSQYLYTFLAWLNLDLGITTCLYDGMDKYSETWLEFVFPAYLLSIIIAIVLFYRKFPALAHKVCGENAVKVIATPLLLFYTKLQQTVVTIISVTTLEYPDGTVRHVWLYDANVEIFKGKHLYLGIAGVFVLVFIILPYALCLTFFQQLQACSGHRLFQWVNKLKPVFDSYAGPYKDKYRFWTGMLLLVRTLLIVLFAINTSGSVEITMLIILAVSSALLIAQSNGIYMKWPCNFLEAFFYAQLIVFAAGVAYVTHNGIKVMIVADSSIGVAVIVFLAVLGYHVMGRIRTLKNHCYKLKGYTDVEDFLHSRDIEREIDSIS